MSQKTLRREILLFTIIAMLLVACLIAVFSVSLYRQYSLFSRLEAASYSLGTAKASLERFVQESGEFRVRVQSSPAIREYLSNTGSGIRRLEAYAFLEENYHRLSGRAWYYRIAVMPSSEDSFVQAGNSLVYADPITAGELSASIDKNPGKSVYSSVIDDPTLPDYMGKVLPVTIPIYDYNSTGQIMGWLYIEIGLEALLKATPPLGDNSFFFIGEGAYENSDASFEASVLTCGKVLASDSISTYYRTQGGYLVKTDGGIYGEDLAIGLLVPSVMSNEVSFLLVLILGILISVAAAGAVFMFLLHRMFRAPVERIRSKALRIAEGDYSRDISIETENEFGDIGRSLNDLAGKLEIKIKEQVEDERKRQELEYRMLQSQINPHFVNNTLNAIKMMADMQGAKGISEMTTSLARLMKHIAKSASPICALSDEMSLLDDYFSIFYYRYGGTVSFQKDVPDGLLSTELPRFSLQPIVENAIFHGIEPNGGIGTITISARKRDGKVEVNVTDDGVGMDEETLSRLLHEDTAHGGMFRSIGLKNVSERIEYSFGKGYGITEIESEPGAGTSVTLTLPGEGR